MRIFVTGGAGYIGSVCTEQLLNEGHEVAIFDNLSEGHRGAVDPRARFIERPAPRASSALSILAPTQ
jgi:UDP-glucose 4-epimerase